MRSRRGLPGHSGDIWGLNFSPYQHSLVWFVSVHGGIWEEAFMSSCPLKSSVILCICICGLTL